MAQITSKQLRIELKQKKLEWVYLFKGEEYGEKEKLLKIIATTFFGDNKDTKFQIRRFHIEDEEFSDAILFAVSQSMFSNKKICIMENINKLKTTKNNLTLYKELIDTLPKSTLLIMITHENSTPSFLSPDIPGTIRVVQFWKFFIKDLQNYINTSFINHKINIDRKAIYLLIELTGRDIKKIDNAIERILDSGETNLITPEIVIAYIHDEKDASIFDFINALFRKEKSAFSLLIKLFEDKIHELQILAMIMRQAEMIEKYHFFIYNGMNTNNALKKIGISSRNRDTFLQQTEIYSQEVIGKIFPSIFNADLTIKTKIPSKNIVSNSIFELVTSMLI